MAISTRIFVQIVLMIIFGEIEVLQRLYLYNQRTGVVGSQPVNGFTNNGQVGGIRIIDTRAILCTSIPPLLIEAGRVNRFEIKVDKESIGKI